MQVQKTQVKNKIVSSTIQLICQKGYKNTSIRNIAQLAGITPGNIYAYFESKDDILSFILDKCVYEFNDYIQHLYQNEMYTPSLLKNVSNTITNLFITYKAEFLILFEKAEGTKYENIKDEIILAIAKRIHKDLMLHSDYAHDILLSQAISTAFVEGLIKILTTAKEDEERLRKIVDDFTQIIFTVNFSKLGDDIK